ncbi:hypothetical protein WJR50_13390 [Catalinimonas sp. 4WD22]|uniref:hypothetical protein n=1 Tax=Catalinimonas locisalis TaxID=3133978 RepID=UPI003100D968
MRNLDDSIWRNLTGGYQIFYDPSIALKKLERVDNEKDEDLIWEELWQELYHQGDIGTASLLTIPQLIRIYKIKNRANYQVFAFITAVELSRVNGAVSIPPEFKDEYQTALDQLPQLIDLVKNQMWDSVLAASVLSATAIWKRKYKMAELISELEDEDLTVYLLDQVNEY